MKLSHSKLSTILSCPMTYYLSYVEGISPILEKPALYIGSAVHWGIEHNTEDLTEFFGSENEEYTRDQMLAEAMVHGYFKHKDEIFDQILTRPDGTKMKLMDEKHELYITGKLKSNKLSTYFHDFVGIIDLLLLTNDGFIVIDYKTSSSVPEWNNYLEQIYRYIFLLRSEFPDVPIAKIGIVNIRKTNIRQKKTENWLQFLNRMKFEYDLNDESYVNYHEYKTEDLDPKLIDNYIGNLSKMADAADIINNDKLWFINYSAANGLYGKSQFWDIFYHTPDAHLLYKINDTWFEDDELKDSRPCVPIDMMVIDYPNVMNHYDKYKYERQNTTIISKEQFDKYLHDNFICDDSLLKVYEYLYSKEFPKRIF